PGKSWNPSALSSSPPARRARRLFNHLVRKRWMTRQCLDIDRLECGVLVLAVLRDPIEVAGRDQLQRDGLVAFVFPEPAVNAGAWREKRPVRLALPGLVVQFVALEVVGAALAL